MLYSKFIITFTLFIYITPIGYILFDSPSKPIILNLSHILLIFIALYFIKNIAIYKSNLLAVFPLIYFPFLGIASSAFNGGAFPPLLSMISFSLPMAHFFIGVLYRNVDPDIMLMAIGRCLATLIIALTLTDLINGSLPRGCGYQGRWGGCVGPFDVFGFVNASANMFVILSPTILFLYKKSKNKFDIILSVISGFCLIIITYLSLSRSASLIITLLIIYIIINRTKILFPAFIFLLVIFILYNIEYFKNSFLLSGVINRIQYSFIHGDIFTGRLVIWEHAFINISNKPFFGNKFDYFSNISEFGTVHQQYLELLFKSGSIGFLIYFSFIIYIYKVSILVLRKYSNSTETIRLISFMIVISGLFQPILSYHVMANLLFFWAGYILERNQRTTKGLFGNSTSAPDKQYEPV